jgi:hypothetical protein
MTITLNLQKLILIATTLTIFILVGNFAMDSFWNLNEIAHQYSS